MWHVAAILDGIVKSPSYFFPSIPLVFGRSGTVAFVPNDDQEHLLDWRSLVLQFHIAIQQTFRRRRIGGGYRVGRSTSSGGGDASLFSEAQAAVAGASWAVGSMVPRQQSACVTSFGGPGIASPSFERLRSGIVPGLNRFGGRAAIKDE